MADPPDDVTMPNMTADATHDATGIPITQLERVALFARVWVIAAQVQMSLRHRQLPDVVAAIPAVSRHGYFPPALLSRAVTRSLHIGHWRPRCLLRSLVLYRLLREQGDAAELVIGLHEEADTHDAHAWVELRGDDVGPWPGRGRHAELARYPRTS